MINVIERHELKKVEYKKYKVECVHCHSILEYSADEEISEFNPNGYEGMCTDWSITCPVCNNNTPTYSLTEFGNYDWRIYK